MLRCTRVLRDSNKYVVTATSQVRVRPWLPRSELLGARRRVREAQVRERGRVRDRPQHPSGLSMQLRGELQVSCCSAAFTASLSRLHALVKNDKAVNLFYINCWAGACARGHESCGHGAIAYVCLRCSG